MIKTFLTLFFIPFFCFSQIKIKTSNYFTDLTSEENRIIVLKGTERPNSGIYNNHFKKGIYICKACNNPLFESKDGHHPILLKEYLGKRISLETMIVLDDLVEFSKRWDKELEWDDFVWPDVKKLMENYKGFLTINTNKYRMKLLKLIEESS